jgi:hypothetical protein
MRARIHMKAFGVLGLSLAACSGENLPPPPKPPIGSLVPVQAADAGGEVVTAKERALPDLYATALSSQAPDAGAPFAQLGPLMNPDNSEFQFPGSPPGHEPSGIVAAYANLLGAFDDRKITNTRVWRTPNEQTIEWVFTGTQAREWNGVAATKKPAAFKGLTLMWTKDDGTIKDTHVYFDLGLVKAQLQGAGPRDSKELKDLAALPPSAASAGPAQVFEQKPDDRDEVAVVKTWLDALENNKEADYVASVADDVEIHTLESPASAKGKEEVRKYFKATHRAIGQLDTTVNAAWSVGNFAIVEYDLDGEQLAPISWIPLLASLPTGNTRLAHFDLVDVCEIQNGKIARIWRYDNPVEILR